MRQDVAKLAQNGFFFFLVQDVKVSFVYSI